MRPTSCSMKPDQKPVKSEGGQRDHLKAAPRRSPSTLSKFRSQSVGRNGAPWPASNGDHKWFRTCNSVLFTISPSAEVSHGAKNADWPRPQRNLTILSSISLQNKDSLPSEPTPQADWPGESNGKPVVGLPTSFQEITICRSSSATQFQLGRIQSLARFHYGERRRSPLVWMWRGNSNTRVHVFLRNTIFRAGR